MFRGIITALFAGAVVAGLASTAYAKPRVQTQPQGGFTTRSGASLRGLERQSESEDILPETSPISQPAPILGNNSQPATRPQSITIFGETIQLGNRGASQNSGNRAPSHVEMRNVEVEAGASSLDPDRVLRLQYQLLSPPEKK
jgi:hypothetical protein